MIHFLATLMQSDITLEWLLLLFLEIRHFCQLIGVCVFCSFLSYVSLLSVTEMPRLSRFKLCITELLCNPTAILRNVVSSCKLRLNG